MVDRFFEEWRVYEKLLIHDYMDHRTFFARLQTEIEGRFERPVAILDLGCGDLTPILPLLAQISLRKYVGIDESDAALAQASKRLEELRAPCRLVKGDLLASLAEIEESFDVILASFSLHHYADPADKRLVLEAARQRLEPEGFFALIDIFSAGTEPREKYLERWIKYAENHYVELQAHEKTLLYNHVRARDFPVSLAKLRALGKQAGLESFDVLLEDSVSSNVLVTFSQKH